MVPSGKRLPSASVTFSVRGRKGQWIIAWLAVERSHAFIVSGIRMQPVEIGMSSLVIPRCAIGDVVAGLLVKLSYSFLLFV